jgi:chemotaxis protein methyltransferase CheR
MNLVKGAPVARGEWLQAILGVVSARFGQVIPDRRLSTFRQAVLEAYVASGAASLEEYRSRIATDALESALVADLIGRITIKESYFFRDEAVMATLRDVVIPRLLARNAPSRRLSIWSAGCSNGEEPYSLSILVDQLLPAAAGWTIRIVGTDVDEGALRVAARGEYGEWSVRGVPPAVRERYFETRGAKLRLCDRHRRWVRFEAHNLADQAAYAPEPSTFDLILCRNVGIYLSDDAAAVLYEKLGGALAPHGVVVTAPSDPRPPAESGLVPVLLQAKAHTTLAYALDSRMWESTSRPPRVPLPSTIPPPRPVTPPPSLAPLQVELEPNRAPCVKAAAEPQTSPIDVAMALAETGDRDGAIRVLERAIEAAPLSASAYFALALLDVDAHRHGEAEALLRKALYLAPDFADAHYRLGLLLARRGDIVGGRRSLLTALRVAQAAENAAPAWVAAIGAQLAWMERKP